MQKPPGLKARGFRASLSGKLCVLTVFANVADINIPLTILI